MAKTNITEFSNVASNNTDINSVNIDENCPASNLNNALRELMKALKDVDTGSQALTALSVTGALSAKGGAVFNEDSADVDFRVESNNQANMLFVDGGNDTVSFQPNSASLTIKAGSADATNNIRLEAGGTTSTYLEYRGYLGHQFYVDTSERLRINSSGIGIGTSSPATTLDVNGSSTFDDILLSTVALPSAGNPSIALRNTDNVVYHQSGSANSIVLLDSSQNTMYNVSSSSHIFNTNNNEAMRIDSNNFLLIGTSIAKGMLNILRNTNSTADPTVFLAGDGTTNVHISFGNSSGTVLGTIRSNSGGIQYNTSSDYRLKENVITDWDATTRLKQLKPSRFNFIADADTTVDGFLAHEVSSIVPEAISGEKDATEDIVNVVLNADGTVNSNGVSESDWTAGKSDETYASDTTWVASKTVPSYQGIDQSKLVPLLTKALQEQQATIEALTARIVTLENA